MRPPRTAIAVVLLFGATACANGMTLTGPRSIPVVRVTERQNKGTVALRRGQQLRVVLHSTYWEFRKSSNPDVLRLDHGPRVHPVSGCVPGGGCGTVTVTYLAASVGAAVVTATRSSCGEAMGCTNATGRFTVHVIVRR